MLSTHKIHSISNPTLKHQNFNGTINRNPITRVRDSHIKLTRDKLLGTTKDMNQTVESSEDETHCVQKPVIIFGNISRTITLENI